MWNVKCKGGEQLRAITEELIETLWNVKHTLLPYTLLRHLRINRNIVECKDVLLENVAPLGIELIETLWNVKRTRLGMGARP